MLEHSALRKTYGGVVALAGADFTVRAGSVHALLGANGAGKSTLVKIVAGAVVPDSGELRLDGEPVQFANTAQAARNGVAVVSQELNLFGDLDVLANLFTLPRDQRGPFIDRGPRWPRKARPVLAELGLDVSLRTPAGGAHARRAAADRDRQGDAHRPARADPRRADLGARARRAPSCCSARCACCATARSASCSSRTSSRT